MSERLDLGDVQIDFIDRGTGPTVFLLHGFYGLRSDDPFVADLALRARVIAPTHPGFGHSVLPDWVDSVDDLTYIYRRLLRSLDIGDAVIVGLSLGGWIAAEMATKSTAGLSGLVLVDSLGVKFGDREARDIADIFAMPDDRLARALYHDPANALDPVTLSDPDLEAFVRSREASALYMWQPYAHNPKLRRRLALIDVPTLILWGEQDAIVTPDYGRALCDAIPDATFETIPNAAHLPHVDCPRVLADRIMDFVAVRRMKMAV
jgi:pimeloyl-ACP methyl ester carboxylesterase